MAQKSCLLRLPEELVDKLDHQARLEHTSPVGLVHNILEMGLPLRRKYTINSPEIQQLINGARLHGK